MGCRPSEIFNVDSPVQAFCFDRAVHYFGTTLSNELEAVDEKTAAAAKRKRQRILSKWIPEASVGFKDPASREI